MNQRFLSNSSAKKSTAARNAKCQNIELVSKTLIEHNIPHWQCLKNVWEIMFTKNVPDEKRYGLFMDLSTVFDGINHNSLLVKLKSRTKCYIN